MCASDQAMTSAPSILIAGGGIGGLATALALARHGIASHILERRSDVVEDGAGIQISPNGVKVLRLLGVSEKLAPLVGQPTSIIVNCAARGQRLQTLPLGAWIENRHGAPYWVAHRADLHGTLLAAVRETPAITCETGVGVESAAQTTAAVAVRTSDGRTITTDALIGADGLWSTIRAQHFDDRSASQTGLSAARAVVPAAQFQVPWARENTGVWLLPGAHVVHYPVRDSQEIAIVLIFRGHHNDDSWSSAMSADAVATLDLPLHSSIAAPIRAVTSWRRWSLVTRPPLNTMANGRIALLGDAAHPMLPFLAQGAVMSLEDAATLAACLAHRPGDATAALQRYQDARLSRTHRVARTARRNGRIYHLGGPAGFARDTVLRLLSGERVMSGYDWLYGYTPTRDVERTA
jgi:salicylate hydroxylase